MRRQSAPAGMVAWTYSPPEVELASASAMTRPASGTGEPPSVAEQLNEKSMVAPATVLARPATSVLFAPTPPMLYMSSRPSPEKLPDR